MEKVYIDHKSACGQKHVLPANEVEVMKKEYKGEVFTLIFFECPVLGPSVEEE